MRHVATVSNHIQNKGFSMNRQGKTKYCSEERIHNANRSSWRAVNIDRSKDVPWRGEVQKDGGKCL